MSTPWNTQRDGFLEAMEYMRGRKIGKITSFKTPYKIINDATIDGFEWNSLVVIGGRPGTGKTLMKDQIIREGIKLNCLLEEYESGRFPFRILEFSLEMVKRVSALRDLTSVLGKSYKYLCSTDDVISDEDLEICLEYSEKRVKYPIDIIDESCTVSKFGSIIERYMDHHKVIKDDKVIYKNTIVTLDHSILLKKDKGEYDKFEMLHNLGEKITYLKRKYPICFIVLSQLNRNVDSVERSKEGTYGNYVLDSDIFGGDALLQHADVLIGLNRPGARFIKKYGPEKYLIDDDSILVAHFLKSRNGAMGVAFFKGEYDKMQLKEIPEPGRYVEKPEEKSTTKLKTST